VAANILVEGKHGEKYAG